MLGFFDPKAVSENASAVAEALQSGTYFDALNKMQPRKIKLPNSELPTLDFARSDQGEALIRHFLGIDDVTDEMRFAPDDEPRLANNIESGFDVLRAAYPASVDSVRVLVAEFLFAKQKGSGGASLGDQLGVIWLNPPARWERVDYAEAILHESVHQALFLHEMVNRVYDAGIEEMEDEESLVVSAVRRERRPYDASFHAACVAFELRGFYLRLGDDERATPFTEGLQQTLPELVERRRVLTDVGDEILGQMVNEIPGARDRDPDKATSTALAGL
jgi:hypothetical protein